MKKEKHNEETFAIFETGGKQYTVKSGDKVLVEKLSGSAGDEVVFEEVLLVRDGQSGETKVGEPILESSRVTGRILGSVKGKKVVVFKKKRRKGYRLKHGHRQAHTEVLIESVTA